MGGLQSTLANIPFDFYQRPKIDDENWELLDYRVFSVPGGEPEPPKVEEKPPSPKPDPVKITAGRTARIIERVEIMIHVSDCKDQFCLRQYCKVMKPVMIHNEICDLGDACKVPHCSSATQIKNHWKICFEWDCPICWPAKKDSPIMEELLESLEATSWSDFSSIA